MFVGKIEAMLQFLKNISEKMFQFKLKGMATKEQFKTSPSHVGLARI